MTYELGKTSRSRLEGVNPNLVRVVERAIQLTDIDFMVLEGLRTKERQQSLVASGASKTMNSRHLTGDAVDVAPLIGGKIPWDDFEKFKTVSRAMFAAADELSVPLEWGGNWSSFVDGPHYQLPWPHKRKAAEEAMRQRQQERASGLSPDITPGLKPEDMRDEDYEPTDIDAGDLEL